MKFNLVDGYIKFLTHTVEVHDLEHSFYDEESKNNFTQRLDGKNIEYTVTEHEQPTQEILQRCEGRKFNTMQEAQEFVKNGEKLDEITELQLAMAELYEIVIGGGIDG